MPGTIGKPSTGANTALTADNWANECLAGASFRYTAGANETVTSVRTRGDGTGSCEVGVYVWDGSVPTTLVGSATIAVGAGDAEYSTTVSWALTNGVTYVVGVDYQASIGADWNIHYDTGQGAGATSISANVGALASTWAQSSTSTDASTFWAVVESSGTTGTAANTLADFTSDASGTFTDWTTFDDGVSATPGATVTGLDNGTTYEFRVFAVNAVGQGPASNVVSETPESSGVTGTAANTLASFTSSASGTVSIPPGAGVSTLANFTSSASGTVSLPPGSGASTLANFTSTATGWTQVTGTAANTLADFTSAATGSLFAGRAPESISGRKVLDQNGDVFIMLTASAWSMADLSDANITTVLEGLQDAGFNGVTVWSGGGYHINSTWEPEYERKSDSSDWWTGTPWASSFGSAWNAMDHIADECARLGMVLNFSFCGGFDTTGAGPDWEAVTNLQMYNVGIAVATRYPIATYPNIVWHFMLDDANSPGSTRGARISSLFDGINDTEGGTTRPVRWMEPANGASASSQGWLNLTDTKISVNVWYEYSDSHVVEIEGVYAQAAVPVGDCEPPYDGSPNAGASHAGLRIRTAATFIEGGCLINWGHEDLWPFGKTGLFSEGLTYTQVLTHSSTLDAGRIFEMLRPYVEDATWAPVSTFVTTGEGTGTSKAAQGASDTSAIACFPNSRSIQINTTILTGTDPVQIRWYDPTDGTYDVVTSSEAQQSGRSVTHPGTNAGGGTDWLLVVEPTDTRTGTATNTLANFTSAATGWTQITGTATNTLQSFTSTATGSLGTGGAAAGTLANFTSSASGTYTPPGIGGTSASTLANFTSSASGTVGRTGTGGSTLAAFISAASGTVGLPPITGTAANVLANFTSLASEGQSTNFTVVVSPPVVITRSVSHYMESRSVGANDTVDRSTGIPDFVDRSVTHSMVARNANDPVIEDRSATITLGHGSPDPPTF